MLYKELWNECMNSFPLQESSHIKVSTLNRQIVWYVTYLSEGATQKPVSAEGSMTVAGKCTPTHSPSNLINHISLCHGPQPVSARGKLHAVAQTWKGS